MAHEYAVVDVDDTPHSVTSNRDGSRVYVTHFLPGTVSVIDTATNTVERTIKSTPGLYGITAHPTREHIYVAENNSDHISRIDLIDDSRLNAGIGVRPYGLAMSPDGARLFATTPLGGGIEVLDPGVKNDCRIDYRGFPTQVAVEPNGTSICITDYFAETVVCLDISGLTSGDFHFEADVMATIPVDPNPYGISITPNGEFAYIAHFGSDNMVTVIDLAKRTVMDTIPVAHGMVRGVTATAAGARIYVTNYFSGSVSVIDI